MRRPAATSQMQQQMLMQQALASQQQSTAAESLAFEEARRQNQAAAASRVAGEQAQLEAEKQKKARTPVKLGTLLTQGQGILGNPLLSGAKLGG